MLDKFLRQLPDFKGKRRLAGIFMKNRIKQATDISVRGRYGCNYLLPNLKETVANDIFINGIYEKEIGDFLIKNIPEKGHFLDLGANIGAISIPLCKCRNDIEVVAVEAAPWIYTYLKKNIEINGLKNIRLINNALYEKDDLQLDFYIPKEKFGKGSLSPIFTNESVKVKTITIDTLIEDLSFNPIDVIKIDVEGFEYFVFKGGDRLLSGKNAPVIVFEFIDWAENSIKDIRSGDAQRLLVNFGYQLYRLDNKGKLIPQDPVENGSYNLVASKTLF